MKDNKLEEILEYHLGYNPARHNLADIKNDLEELYISKEEVEKLETYQVSTIPELLGKELIDKNKLT